jgi:hypothetical protein
MDSFLSNNMRWPEARGKVRKSEVMMMVVVAVPRGRWFRRGGGRALLVPDAAPSIENLAHTPPPWHAQTSAIDERWLPGTRSPLCWLGILGSQRQVWSLYGDAGGI